MKTIAYYISDYGYGHASRSIAIIRKLLEKPDVRIIVCNSFALGFIKESLNSSHVMYREIKTDVGYYLKSDTIDTDRVRLFKEYTDFVSSWNAMMGEEEKFLKQNDVKLVISDVSPLPFEAAENLGIPSLGLSNFTWYSAYNGLIDEMDLWTFKRAYQKMSYYFSLAGSREQWDVLRKEYGFFSRDVDVLEISRIRENVNPTGHKKIIFLGLGMKIGVSSLEQLPIWDSPDCIFIVSSNVHVERDNVFQIPDNYLESQNYIAATDLVISKAGWGMVGEAVSSNVPLLILDRPTMDEDQNTISYLKQNYIVETINWEEFVSYQVDVSRIAEMKLAVIEQGSKNNEVQKIVDDIMAIL